MTVTVNRTADLPSLLINGILSISPLAKLMKHQARQLIINRAEKMGISWRKEAQALSSRNWDEEMAQVKNPNVTYPDYYVKSFHAYDEGNLGWVPATEVEVASLSVHAKLWPDGVQLEGDNRLRQSYLDILKAEISSPPSKILDFGCGAGMSTFRLQSLYPKAQITGLDLSPYFLSVALYRSQQREASAGQTNSITWLNAAMENTGLPDSSFDLVSTFLVYHELPQSAIKDTLREAKRLLRPGGHFTMMDMNPKSEIYSRMSPYIMTLLKSTEPWLDEYFSLDLEQTLTEAGFTNIKTIKNSPRHRTVMAQA
jgi:ubiquinone/menaquinone biosynthesis C-methylase UbiE